MRKLIMAIALFSAAIAPDMIAAPPFGDGFATGKVEDYLEKADPKAVLKKLDGVKGKSALCITDNTMVQFKAVEAVPNIKYTLSFRGCFSGGESVEENPRLDIAVMPRRNFPFLPYHEIEFLDAEKKKIQQPGIAHGLPFRQWHEYSNSFYTPGNAAYIRLNVRSAPGITFSMDSLKLEKTPDEGAINVNPDFKCGLYSYSGWSSLAVAAKMILSKDGKPAFDTKYGSTSMSFPVSEPGTYEASSKFTGNGYNSNIAVRFYDKDGKMTGSFGVWAKNYFILPKGTSYGNFLIYSGVLEELRLVRVGDENKISELLKK
ncbi:MAG: hypothetical protein A2X49_12885 [Lentisphaerae bacterium GWF2_52_8]|nr:MAG: hypothetical protein A2X49_12885 [Lentisphaerae bacterium GWF2_52_8]